jgi:amidase
VQSTYRNARDWAAELRSGKTGALDLLEAHIARVEERNPAINAVVSSNYDQARQRAKEADEATARGESWGPLHGLPMTVKDTYEAAGMTATAGSPDLKDYRPVHSATAVQRLEDAGAIVFGKTNVPLFADDVQSYNQLYGTTNNPWNVERTPGGSSGGSAAALAAGFTPLELGSDIGGSIRNPAHFCGVYGHKSSYTIIPMQGHIPPLPGKSTTYDIGVAGPLARSADDLDLALSLLAGPEEGDAKAWRLELPAPKLEALKDFRVAAWLDEAAFPIDSSVGTVLQNTVDAIAKAGAKVDDRARPIDDMADTYELYLELLYANYGPSLPPETLAHYTGKAAALEAGDRSYGARFARGISQRHSDWLQANERRQKLRGRWAAFFEDFDILLCPVMATAAFPHDQSPSMGKRTCTINGEARPYLDQLAWAALTGVVYLPATVAPVGQTAENLPVGLQIVAPYLEDRTAIRFAQLLADVTGGFTPPPGY